MGQGSRYEKLSEELQVFKAMNNSDENFDNNLKVWLGNGNPPEDVNIWIKRDLVKNFQEAVKNLKEDLKKNPNLEMSGIEYLDCVPLFSQMSVVVSRDNVVHTFQSDLDLNEFLKERFEKENI